jgi:ABC-type antimicrobial peptide transport system permease subunit
MGIRLALGALPMQVRGLVQRGALTQVAVGLGFGFGAAMVTTRIMSSLLYEVNGADPVAFGAAAGLLVLVSLIASWFPAWRMARLDPMLTIRAE